MEHFELQAHTKIPASDLERDGTQRILSRLNELQCVCEGAVQEPSSAFLISPYDAEVQQVREHPISTPFY